MSEKYFKRKPAVGHTVVEQWMMSLGDLLSLLLGFFILLYSMTQISSPSYEEIRTSFHKRLTDPLIETQMPAQELLGVDPLQTKPGLNLDYLALVLEQKLGKLRKSGFTVRRLDDRLIITLPEEALFPPGSADLNEAQRRLLDSLGDTLSRVDNSLQLLGQANAEPIATDDIPSNWELSMQRALVVANHLRDAGYGAPITVLGAGSSRYREIVQPDEDGSGDFGRRVDIIIRQYE